MDGSNDNSSGNDAALIGGLAVGGVALVIIIAVVTYCWCCMKKKMEDSGLASGPMNNHRLKVSRLHNDNPSQTANTSSYEELQRREETNETTYTELNRYEISHNNLTWDTQVGGGNFGEVWKGKLTNSQVQSGTSSNVVAIKNLKESAEDQDKNDFKNEMKIMKNMDPHPNVVKLIGYCSNDPLILVIEFMPKGDLKSFLRGSRGRHIYGNLHGNSTTLSQNNLIQFALEISKGMEHISKKMLLHRDLAARNILLDQNNVCKISDFGYSKDIEESRAYESTAKRPLPIRWMAPESIFDNLYTAKSDVWSFGVLLYEIVTLGATPYPGMSGMTLIKEVNSGYRMEKPAYCDSQMYAVMTKCWQQEPEDRPTFTQLKSSLQHLLDTEHQYIDILNIPEHVYEELSHVDRDNEKI